MAKHVRIAGRSFSIPEGNDLGEKNTSSNAGTGAGLALPKAGSTLPFKSLVAGANVTFDIGSDTITINSTGEGGTSTGEANTASNLGLGYGWFAQKSGVDLQFKSILAGTNVSLSQDASSITVNVPSIGEVNTAANLGTGTGLYAQKSTAELQFKGLKAGANVTITSSADSVTIASTDTGEANTSSNAGGGVELAKAKVGVNLPFRTLVPGRHITLTTGTDTVTIASTDTGEANTASNLGATGEGVFAQKSGVDLQFKKLKAGSNVTLTSDTESVTISSTDVDTGEVNTASNQGTGEGLVMAKSGVDLPFKTIKAGSNISLSSTANELTITSTGGSAGLAPFRNKVVNGDFSAFKSMAYQDTTDSGKITARWELFRAASTGAAHLEETGKFIFGKPRFDVNTMMSICNDTAYSPVDDNGGLAVIRTSIDAVSAKELFDTPITLSFYVQSNKTGTYCVALTANPNTLRYVAEITITQADTWEYKTISLSGGIPYTGNEVCFDYPETQPWLFVNFVLYAGTSYQTTAGSWSTTEGQITATANQVNFGDSLDNYLNIAAVQLEKGSATLFDNTSQALMIETCARTYNHWQISVPNVLYPFSGRAKSATEVAIPIALPALQLITAHNDLTANAEGLVLTNGTTDYTISAISVAEMLGNYVILNVTTTGMTTGDIITFKSTSYGSNLRVYASDW